MFDRLAHEEIREALSWSPAVAILGARQIGKTTLAQAIAQGFFRNAAQNGSQDGLESSAESAPSNGAQKTSTALYLDLDNPQALARLAQPELFLAANRERLIVLDEIQNRPELFSVLRGEIDADPRPGRFLILGSASFKLLQQSQSLAGRLALVDMAPLMFPEVGGRFDDLQPLWLRGGFPRSYLAASDKASWAWRDAFLRQFLNTDLPGLGINVDPELMRRFWRMLAHLHGQLFNASAIAASLGVSAPTVARYLDHLTHSLMLRRLEP
ncbi:MAG: ATP-binding protein, partial [Hydrogenophaga sp.]